MKARRSATHLAFDPQMIPLAYCTPRLIIAGWILPTLPKLNRIQFKFKNKHIIIDTKPNCCSLSIYRYLTLSYSCNIWLPARTILQNNMHNTDTKTYKCSFLYNFWKISYSYSEWGSHQCNKRVFVSSQDRHKCSVLNILHC